MLYARQVYLLLGSADFLGYSLCLKLQHVLAHAWFNVAACFFITVTQRQVIL